MSDNQSTPMPLQSQFTSFGHDVRTYQAPDDNLLVLAVDGLHMIGLVNEQDNIVLVLPLIVAPTLADAEAACDRIRNAKPESRETAAQPVARKGQAH